MALSTKRQGEPLVAKELAARVHATWPIGIDLALSMKRQGRTILGTDIHDSRTSHRIHEPRATSSAWLGHYSQRTVMTRVHRTGPLSIERRSQNIVCARFSGAHHQLLVRDSAAHIGTRVHGVGPMSTQQSGEHMDCVLFSNAHV